MRIAICDAEASAAEYRALLTELMGTPTAIDTFHSGKELLFALEDGGTPIDLLFLAVPGQEGIGLAHRVRQQFSGEIIFLADSEAHMLHAFDVGAFHYIVKGQTPQSKLEDICKRAVETIRRRRPSFLTVSRAGESRRIPLADIRFFEVRNDLILVHDGGTPFAFYSTLSRLEDTLAESGFVRAHRSYLVNLARVRRVTRRELELDDGTRIPVGRKYAGACAAGGFVLSAERENARVR